MKIKLLSFLLVLGLASNVHAAEWTAFQSVDLVDTVGSTQTTLIIPVGNKWGSPSCPNAAYVVLNGTMASYKEMLASLLTAKAAGLKVRFFGDCGTAPYFTANKMRIQ